MMADQSPQPRSQSQIKPDFGRKPTPQKPTREKSRVMNSLKNPIVLSDSDDDGKNQGGYGAANQQKSTPTPRPLKRSRISSNPLSHSPGNVSTDTIRATALRRAQDEVTRLEKEIECLREDLSEEREKSTQTQQAQKEVATLKETIAKMEADANAASQQHDDAQNNLKKKIEKLEEEISDNRHALLDLDDLKIKLKDAEANIAKKQLELSQTQSTLTNTESKKDLDQQKAKRLEEEVTQLRAKISGREKELESANANIAQLEGHTDNCVLASLTPEFLNNARATMRRLQENHEKRNKGRGWA